MTGAVRSRIDASGQKRWIADVTVDGKRRQASGRTKAEAERKRKELRDHLMAEPVVNAAGFTLAQARQLSLEVRWAGLPYERTAAIYSAAAVQFSAPRHRSNRSTPRRWSSGGASSEARATVRPPSTGRFPPSKRCPAMPCCTDASPPGRQCPSRSRRSTKRIE